MQRYCSAEVVSPVLKFESGLCLFDPTLVAPSISYCWLVIFARIQVQKQDLLMAKRGTY